MSAFPLFFDQTDTTNELLPLLYPFIIFGYIFAITATVRFMVKKILLFSKVFKCDTITIFTFGIKLADWSVESW